MSGTGSQHRPPGRPLAAATAWLITDDKAGNKTLVRGVADALGCRSVEKEVAPRGIYRRLAPWGPVDPAERFAGPASPFSPPWPQLAIAAGRASIPYLVALRRAAGFATFCVVLLDPRRSPRIADLVWVPAHDHGRCKGTNVISTLTSPHAFSAERLEALRAAAPPEIASLPGPRVAVLVGGPNRAFAYRDDAIGRLGAALAALAGSGAGLMMTFSRRTTTAMREACLAALRCGSAYVWSGEGANPYPQLLAQADHVVVTADSVNMAGEAAATGRPVHVFHPSQGGGKFKRYHDMLEAAGIARPLVVGGALASWSYRPLFAADVIAEEIESRMARRLAMLGGAERRS